MTSRFRRVLVSLFAALLFLTAPTGARTNDTLQMGYGLWPGDHITSSSGEYHMYFGYDGALTIFEDDWTTVVWGSSPTTPWTPYIAMLDWWGGLAIILDDPEMYYYGTYGLYCVYNRGEYGRLLDDGTFTVFDDGDQPIWSTAGGCL